MAQNSKIEWCESTWNPATGCTKVSPGCAHCYIERTPPFRVNHRRFDAKGAIPIQLHPERLTQPLRWKRPRRVFVNSLSDLFHEDIPDEFIDQVFAVMAACQQHVFQVLTKRPRRMRDWIIKEYGRTGPLPNVWLGVTAENQRFADERIPLLLQTLAAVRFLSYEPALAEIDLSAYMPHYSDGRCRHVKLDWIIAGGESGPGARPLHPDWARSVRDQCQAAGVPFFFKQWGEWGPESHYNEKTGRATCRVGKKAAGRLLDGREWNEYPKGA